MDDKAKPRYMPHSSSFSAVSHWHPDSHRKRYSSECTTYFPEVFLCILLHKINYTFSTQIAQLHFKLEGLFHCQSDWIGAICVIMSLLLWKLFLCWHQGCCTPPDKLPFLAWEVFEQVALWLPQVPSIRNRVFLIATLFMISLEWWIVKWTFIVLNEQIVDDVAELQSEHF